MLQSAWRGWAAMVSMVGLCIPDAAQARFLHKDVEEVPVERLLRNTERHIAEHPNDARSHAVLARLHAMAFARGDERAIIESERSELGDILGNASGSDLEAAFRGVDTPSGKRGAAQKGSVKKGTKVRGQPKGSGADGGSAGDAGSPSPAPDAGRPSALDAGEPLPELPARTMLIGTRAPEKMDAARLAHLTAAIESYHRAIALAPEQPQAHLGLAWVLEQAGLRQLREPGWEEEALDAYRQAYRWSSREEGKHTMHFPGEFLISPEAADGIARLLKRKSTLSEVQVEELAAVAAEAKRIQSLPYFMTPIIFPWAQVEPSGFKLAELLDAERSVRFDLAGDGSHHLWPWVSPDTGILVWDPRGLGRITSGRQLFGSITWWCLWDDGYQPLRALDDDGDGQLAGAELDGIAVWRDSNSDGISQPEEVRAARPLGIESIAVQATRGSEGTLSNPRGIRAVDGALRPTFDWTPVGVPVPTAVGNGSGDGTPSLTST